MAGRADDPGVRRSFGARRASGLAERILRPAFRERGFRESAIFRKWGLIVGERLARRTAPLKLSRAGALTVRVEPAFGLDFQHQEPVVRERIATVYGYQAVRRIRIVQGPVAGRAPEPGPPPPPAPTGEEREAARARAGGVADPGIREALAALGGALAAAGRERR